MNEKFGEMEYANGNDPEVLSEFLDYAQDAVQQEEEKAIKHVRGDEVLKEVK